MLDGWMVLGHSAFAQKVKDSKKVSFQTEKFLFDFNLRLRVITTFIRLHNCHE